MQLNQTPLTTDNLLLQLLSKTGIDLSQHENTKAAFVAESVHVQWEIVEKILAQRRQQEALCPICRERLPAGDSALHGPEPAALVHHVCECVAATRRKYSTTGGKDFAVSSSMLGEYFNRGGCNRMLHRMSERGGSGTADVGDIESLDWLASAHSVRGNLFEPQVRRARHCGPPWRSPRAVSRANRIAAPCFSGSCAAFSAREASPPSGRAAAPRARAALRPSASVGVPRPTTGEACCGTCRTRRSSSSWRMEARWAGGASAR